MRILQVAMFVALVVGLTVTEYLSIRLYLRGELSDVVVEDVKMTDHLAPTPSFYVPARTEVIIEGKTYFWQNGHIDTIKKGTIISLYSDPHTPFAIAVERGSKPNFLDVLYRDSGLLQGVIAQLMIMMIALIGIMYRIVTLFSWAAQPLSGIFNHALNPLDVLEQTVSASKRICYLITIVAIAAIAEAATILVEQTSIILASIVALVSIVFLVSPLPIAIVNWMAQFRDSRIGRMVGHLFWLVVFVSLLISIAETMKDGISNRGTLMEVAKEVLNVL